MSLRSFAMRALFREGEPGPVGAPLAVTFGWVRACRVMVNSGDGVGCAGQARVLSMALTPGFVEEDVRPDRVTPAAVELGGRL